jgi:hypothetical protein
LPLERLDNPDAADDNSDAVYQELQPLVSKSGRCPSNSVRAPPPTGTLITARSDKEGAAPAFKMGYGFHPLGAWLAAAESLAMLLRRK